MTLNTEEAGFRHSVPQQSVGCARETVFRLLKLSIGDLHTGDVSQ
jgi:hypothetical protein